MQYALQAEDRPDGRLHEVEGFTQRLVVLDGPGGDAGCDEVLARGEFHARLDELLLRLAK